jgi:hypothetical protein
MDLGTIREKLHSDIKKEQYANQTEFYNVLHRIHLYIYIIYITRFHQGFCNIVLCLCVSVCVSVVCL